MKSKIRKLLFKPHYLCTIAFCNNVLTLTIDKATHACFSLFQDDAVILRKRPITRAMSKRLQEDWARATEEGPRVLMNLRVDF